LRKHVNSMRGVVQPLLAGSKGCSAALGTGCAMGRHIQRVNDALWHATALVCGVVFLGGFAEMPVGVLAIKFVWLVYLACKLCNIIPYIQPMLPAACLNTF
jgi:hypothetical protein